MVKEKIKSIDILNKTIYFSKAIKSKLTKNKCLHEPEMLTYRNMYLNDACFIIATGPSLTIEDLELLKGKHSIGVICGGNLTRKMIDPKYIKVVAYDN